MPNSKSYLQLGIHRYATFAKGIVLSGFSGSSFRRFLSFVNGQDARSPSHGLCEVLASTDHLIRFGPVPTFATRAATEDNVKDHLFPESKTLK